ncbi:MAG: hypothetical protein LRY55_10395 [Leadbetterella sp.]|nr:hypothetical protein [Leadbetterella sp.]
MVWHELIVSIAEKRMTLVIVYDKSAVGDVQISELKSILAEFDLLQ